MKRPWKVIKPGEVALGNTRIPYQATDGLEDFLINQEMDSSMIHNLKNLTGFVIMKPGEPGKIALNVITDGIQEFEEHTEELVGPEEDER